MSNLLHLPTRTKEGHFHAVVESPRGSTAKLKYEPDLGVFTMARPLTLGLSYPSDWGFVPGTRAPDGDPLDVLVLHDAATYPGVVLVCRAVAVLRVSQKKKEGEGRERNDRLLAVPVHAARHEAVRSLADVPERMRRELEAFFVAAVAFEDKEIKVEGWGDAAEAERLVEASTKGYKGKDQ